MATATLADRVDFPLTGVVEVGGAEALRALFCERRADHPPIRLCGTATRQRELPAPEVPVQLVSLAGMDRITRLDADDLTCSVEPGLRRAELDAALAEHRLRLACAPSRGTVGGLFALGRESYPEAPGALGLLGTRGLLLGLSGLLAEGRAFKAGAKVVKSVAGFDLQKLFVGSRGRLFAATELHLKLRPLPRAAAAFALDEADPERACARFLALRQDDHPPASLQLLSTSRSSGFVLAGCYEGAARVVADRLRAHGLSECGDAARDLAADEERERLCGLCPPSRLRDLLRIVPAEAPLRVSGTGAFEILLRPAEADRLLVDLPTIEAVAELDLAAPGRRGRATPVDPGAELLERRLKASLDPGSVLT
jgi:FAD/FMN-containing dehydrogenase